MKKIHCFFHGDLDGIVSYLIVKWAFPKENLTYTVIPTNSMFKDILTTWMTTNNIENYKQIFILDLDVCDSYDLIDKKNVFIIDHHESHTTNKPEHKEATVAVKVYSSAAKLTYKLFEKLFKLDTSKEQKALIALTDDYDSYKLSNPLSRDLNILYWSSQKKNETFISNFQLGFRGFTLQQKNIINIYKNDLKELINKLQFFQGELEIQGKNRKIVATMADAMINDVADYINETFDPDIAMIVNVASSHVSFRRSMTKNDDLDLSVWASEIGDGGGHKFSSGCILEHDCLLGLTKKLVPIERNSKSN